MLCEHSNRHELVPCFVHNICQHLCVLYERGLNELIRHCPRFFFHSLPRVVRWWMILTSSCSLSQLSSCTDLTFEMCAPRLRWMPAQVWQMKIPMLNDAHVGPGNHKGKMWLPFSEQNHDQYNEAVCPRCGRAGTREGGGKDDVDDGGNNANRESSVEVRLLTLTWNRLCVCVWERERDRERDRQTDRQRERERQTVCVCVTECVYACERETESV